jgi:uncharacterized membrane protein
MNKMTKLAIAFALAMISSLLIPVFAQWYYQATGIYPVGFMAVYAIGSFVSIVAIATDNFTSH